MSDFAPQDHPQDLLIVGCGPAGMAAAIAARKAGLAVTVADESSAPGGQIYRSVLKPFPGSPALGSDYRLGAALAQRFSDSGAVLRPGATVFLIEPGPEGGFETGLMIGGRGRRVRSRCVLIATGAHERPFPIPGWTLPGVMTAGAAQTMVKASGVVPEGPLHLVGTGPLLYLLAAQYARLGVPVAALLDTAPRQNWLAALPHLPAFLGTSYAWKGIGLLREVLASTRIVRGVEDLSLEGEGRVEEIHYRAGGRRHGVPTRTVLLHQGVVPQVNLAMACGIPHHWNPDRLAFEPDLGPDGQTHQPGLYVAGDSGGIAGAQAAEHRGTLAALAILRDMNRDAPDATAPRAAARKALRGRRFLDALYRPPDWCRVPTADETIVCRCEEVRAGEIRALARQGAQGPNQAKFFSRAGMGPCQGRLCGLTVCETMAAETGRDPEAIGYMRVRMPVKPVPLAAMADLARDPV